MGADFTRLAKKMEERSVVKAVCGDYVIYRRDWLQENIEQEATLIKSAREMHAFAHSVERFKEFLRQQTIKDSKGG